MRRKSSNRKSGSKIVSGLLLLGLLAGAGYIYTAPPEVHSSDSMFWNRKDPLKIKLTDNTGLEKGILQKVQKNKHCWSNIHKVKHLIKKRNI